VSDPRFTLAELIDLELALQRDRETPVEDLDTRDTPLAQHLASALGATGETAPGAAKSPAPRIALRAWLNSVQQPGLTSAGSQFSELIELAGTCLLLAGATSGALTIGSWLLHGTGTPVNVAVFWPAVIGIQLALLAIFGLLASSLRCAERIPGLRGLGRVLTSISGTLPWLTLRALARLSGRPQAEWRQLFGELRALDWLYRRLRIWLMTSLTQAFAIGFNLGALAAFFAIPTLDDPAFGWRSRLLGAGEVHAIVRGIALPWRSWLPSAVPSSAAVEATQYSSVAPRYAVQPPVRRPPLEPGDASPGSDSDRPPWGAWWPFLCVSLATYGLIPRVLLLGLAQVGLRRELSRAPRAHAELERLLARLSRLAVDTRAHLPEEPLAAPSQGPLSEGTPPPEDPLYVLCWAGVPEPDAHLCRRFESAGYQIQHLVRVGGVDYESDENALRELEQQKSNRYATVLIVEAWEPPVGDYLDFVRELRRARGDAEALWVLLFRDEVPSSEAGGSERDRVNARQWEAALRSVGDPWLRIGFVPGPLV